ncbi:MAG: C40 family peptidase [Bacteroidales bacterium]|nr:C40 family peptidase [Bacteroidales bacterium]
MKKLFTILAALTTILASAQEYGVVNISVCNMRSTPDFDAEMVSQALLGTPVHIIGSSDSKPYPWPEIETPDGYTGWVHYAVVTRMTFDQYHAWNAAPKAVVTALTGVVYAKSSTRSATVSDVVAGDRLKLIKKRGSWLKVEFPDGRQGWLQRKTAMVEREWRMKLDQSAEAVLESARSMLGFPYIWAGMSPKGTDCSGFVRAVLFMHDIIIPRDAGPQSQVGERIEDRDDLQPGDLVFFGSRRTDGTPRVSHVGFYLGDGKFIHSLGYVKIGSFVPGAPEYDSYNTDRYLFGGRILPYVNQLPEITTTLTTPFYAE